MFLCISASPWGCRESPCTTFLHQFRERGRGAGRETGVKGAIQGGRGVGREAGREEDAEIDSRFQKICALHSVLYTECKGQSTKYKVQSKMLIFQYFLNCQNWLNKFMY